MSACGKLGLTLPLVGRVARRSVAKAGGVGIEVVERDSRQNCDPHPQPLPTRGRGAHRIRGADVLQTETNARYRPDVGSRGGRLGSGANGSLRTSVSGAGRPSTWRATGSAASAMAA